MWEFVTGSLADSPERVGKPLREPIGGFWSARRVQYRVIYAMEDGTLAVTIATVDHPREVYR